MTVKIDHVVRPITFVATFKGVTIYAATGVKADRSPVKVFAVVPADAPPPDVKDRAAWGRDLTLPAGDAGEEA